MSYGAFGDQQLAIFLVATKTVASRADVIPQQAFFRDFWQRQRQASRDAARVVAASAPGSAWDRLVQAAWFHTMRSPRLLEILQHWKRCRRRLVRLRPRRMPPLVARY